MKALYPSPQDKFWMKPGTDLCDRIGPYSLLAVKSYGPSKREATYQCICLRCGSLHEIRRAKLQGMARAQQRRKLPFRQLHGNCPNCQESDEPRLTLEGYILQKLWANGLMVVHVAVAHEDKTVARVRICDRAGGVAVAEVHQRDGQIKTLSIELEEAGNARWLMKADQMLARLIAEVKKQGITTIAYQEGGSREALYLDA
jgi:hypothetical protein